MKQAEIFEKPMQKTYAKSGDYDILIINIVLLELWIAGGNYCGNGYREKQS